MVGRWRQGRSSGIARCPFAHDGPRGILHPDIRPTPHVRGCSSTGFDFVYPLSLARGALRAELRRPAQCCARGPQIQQLEKYRFCSHILRMTEATPRRTETLKLRQTISQLLDQIFTIEQSMEIFHRKDDPGELERAVENFSEMLGSVDRLGELIADAGAKQHATPDAVPDRAA
jgi:hypothetical protein